MMDCKCKCGETDPDEFYDRSRSQCKKCRRIADANSRRRTKLGESNPSMDLFISRPPPGNNYDR